MSAQVKIFTNGEKVYITLFKEQNGWVKACSVAIVCLIFAGIFVGLYLSKSVVVMNIIFFAAIAFILSLFFLHKEIFWQIKGREYMIISPSTIQYQYDYGVTISEVKSVAINHVYAELKEPSRFVRKSGNRICFVDRATKESDAKNVYLTKFSLEPKFVEEVNQKLDEIYFNEFYASHEFKKISLN